MVAIPERSKPTPLPSRGLFAPHISLNQKIFFVQQLGVMVRSGISMGMALRTLADQTTAKKFQRMLRQLQEEVEKGNLLSKGLEDNQRVFGELFVNMIKAGEVSGRLEDVLRQLFIQMKKDHDIISKIRGAMIYPLIVVVMMVVIGILMMIYVIPTITSVFKELDVILPLPTRILIGLSDFLISYGLFVLLGSIVIGVLLALGLRTTQGKHVWHGIVLRTPIAGPIVRKINLARFCRTLSSLLKTDIPIVQSFEITGHVLGNIYYREALLTAKEKIKKGVGIEQSLRPHATYFPPVVLQMIAVGEQTGALDDILVESAVFYEDEVSQTMSTLPSVLEPVLISVLGVGVGAMAVAIIWPLYSLSQAI